MLHLSYILQEAVPETRVLRVVENLTPLKRAVLGDIQHLAIGGHSQ